MSLFCYKELLQVLYVLHITVVSTRWIVRDALFLSVQFVTPAGPKNQPDDSEHTDSENTTQHLHVAIELCRNQLSNMPKAHYLGPELPLHHVITENLCG